MPQVELKYSDNLLIEADSIFSHIERALNEIDPTAKTCKSRALPVSQYLHSHVFLEVKLLRKPHRNPAFMKNCLEALESILKPFIPLNAYYSVSLEFLSDYYLTSQA